MFKDILIPMIGGDIPETAIQVACSIGEVQLSHVDALVGASMILPNAAVWAYYPEGFYETLNDAASTTVAAAAARVEERMRNETVAHGIRRCSTIWLTTVEMTTLCARYADLVVLGRGKTPDTHRSDACSAACWRVADALSSWLQMEAMAPSTMR